MNTMDEMDRLARANPVPDGSLGAVAPVRPATPPPGRRRARRIIGPMVGALAALALLALIAALIVATPTDHPDAPATFDGTLRVSLLDRPQGAADRLVMVPAGLDPTSLRSGGGDDRVEWFAARRIGAPESVCLIRNEDDRVGIAACGTLAGLADTGLIATAWSPIGADGRRTTPPVLFAGIVPDGIETVSVGNRSATVHDNVFVVDLRGTVPDLAVLSGPAAVAIRPVPDASVIVSASTNTPFVAVAALPDERAPRDPGSGAAPSVPRNPTISGTLAQAAAAMPFTVVAPAAPPLGGGLQVRWSRDDPRLFPQVILSYLPRRSGQGVSIIEGAHRGLPGPRPGERTVVRAGRALYVGGEADPSLPLQVRLVVGGTDVQISGGLPLDGLLDLAASLRPVR